MTVPTLIRNWMHALRTDLADSYLARNTDGKFRFVADGFRFTNEIRFDASAEFFYIVESRHGCASMKTAPRKSAKSSDRAVWAKVRGRTELLSLATATSLERWYI